MTKLKAELSIRAAGAIMTALTAMTDQAWSGSSPLKKIDEIKQIYVEYRGPTFQSRIAEQENVQHQQYLYQQTKLDMRNKMHAKLAEMTEQLQKTLKQPAQEYIRAAQVTIEGKEYYAQQLADVNKKLIDAIIYGQAEAGRYSELTFILTPAEYEAMRQNYQHTEEPVIIAKELADIIDKRTKKAKFETLRQLNQYTANMEAAIDQAMSRMYRFCLKYLNEEPKGNEALATQLSQTIAKLYKACECTKSDDSDDEDLLALLDQQKAAKEQRNNANNPNKAAQKDQDKNDKDDQNNDDNEALNDIQDKV